MILFNSWYYSFSPTLATHLQTHPTQRAIFKDTLYPLFGILYMSYYSYLLMSPVSGELGVAIAGIVAASLIGLVYLSPVLYLGSRLLRRRFRSVRLTASRLYALIAVSVALDAFAYSTGQVLILTIATTGIVLCTLALGSILGTLALTRLELSWPGSPVSYWRMALIKMKLHYEERPISRIWQSLETVMRRL